MKVLEDGPEYGPKHVAVIKWNQCEQLDLFILKYLLCWWPEYKKNYVIVSGSTNHKEFENLCSVKFCNRGWFVALLSCWHLETFILYIQLFSDGSVSILDVADCYFTDRDFENSEESISVCTGNHVHEDGSRANFCYIMFIKNTQNSGDCSAHLQHTMKVFLFRIVCVNKKLWNKTWCKTNPQKLHGFCIAFLQCFRKRENFILHSVELCPAVMNVE